MPTFRYKQEKNRYGGFEDPEIALGKNWAKQIFEIVCNQALHSVNPNGIPGPAARSYQRILNALDISTDDYMFLDRADLEFLKSSLWHERASVSPVYTRAFVLFQTEAERAAITEAEG